MVESQHLWFFVKKCHCAAASVFCMMCVCCIQGDNRDSLLLLTERRNIAILKYDSKMGRLLPLPRETGSHPAIMLL